MSASNRPEVRLPDWLIQNRNFVLLWAAYGVAAIGDHLSEIALLKEREGMTRPDATRVQALISFGFFLPFVLLGPIAGWWSDRFSRKTTMIAADLLRAVVVFNMAAIVGSLARALPKEWGDFSIVIPLAVVGAIAAFFSPARQAMLPTLIRDDQLVRANAMINALGTIGTILSALLGGFLVMSLGPVWNFHINAMTFGLSAIFVSLIAMSRTRAVPHTPLAGVLTPVLDGFRYVASHRRVLQMILLGTVFWAAAGVVVSVLPAIVKVFYGSDYSAAGTFRGLVGIGLATGAVVMTILGPALPLQMAILLALAGGTFWVLALDAAFSLRMGQILTGLCLFGIGGAGAALLVTIMSTIQRFVPDARRGRVFGVSDMLTMGAMVAATGALGIPHFPRIDAYIPVLLLVTALGFGTALVLAWREYRRRDPQPLVRSILWKLVSLYANFWCRLKREGPSRVPRGGPVIIAANHTAGIDPILIQATSLHRVVSFLVERAYYQRPIAGWFMRQVNCIPIDRDNPGRAALTNCLRALENGGCVGIFPQGGFVAPGEPELDAKPGIGLIALRSGATVVPCHISGTEYHDSPLKQYFMRHRVRVRYGMPIDLSPFRGTNARRGAAEEATRLIMERIRALRPVEPA